MNEHHLRYVLRQWIEHKNRENLRLHVWINGFGWLGLVTFLSQIPAPLSIPLLGANIGAWYAVLSVLYWLPADIVVSVAVGLLTVAWANMPFAPWGPGHGWLWGVALPLGVFTAMGITAHFAHIYYHEHASFMKGDPRWRVIIETTHAVIWAPFHFWLEGLLHAGYRPKLKAQLDARERATILRRERVPWSNWSETASCQTAHVCVPQTVDDLADIVRQASAEGRHVRVVASGFSWSSLIPTSDVLIFCERLDRINIDTSDPQNPEVWAEAGVTNKQINRALAKHGLTLPWNVVLENVRLGGLVSVGTHGSGRNTSTMSDLCTALEVIDSNGEKRILSNETVGTEVMQAARMGMGLFGIIARIKLRVVPDYAVRQVNRRVSMEEGLAQLPKLVRECDSVEVFWFPGNKDIWIREVNRTDASRMLFGHGFGFLTANFWQHNFVTIWGLIDRISPRLAPTIRGIGFDLLPFQERVLGLAESNHYRRWLEVLKCRCVEVGFKVDPDLTQFRKAWDATLRLYDTYGARGLDPLNLAVNVRFIGPSEALLSPAYGPGLTCFIEALCAGHSSQGWEQCSAELCQAWLDNPGALPHWVKDFEHVPGIMPLARERLGDRRARFLTAWKKSGVDPRGMFVNPLLERLLMGQDAASGHIPRIVNTDSTTS